MKFSTVATTLYCAETFQGEGRGVALADQVILVAAEPVGAVVRDVEAQDAVVAGLDADGVRLRLVGTRAEGEIVIVADRADGVVPDVRSVVEFPATALGSRVWMKMPLRAVLRTCCC